jgi:hypothetical protein
MSFMSAANVGNRSVEFSIYRDAVIGTGAVYDNINIDNSITEACTGATTVAGGEFICSFVTAPNDGKLIDLNNFDIDINPGQTITIMAFSSQSTTVDVSINWRELF